MADTRLRLAALLFSIALPALGQDKPRAERIPVPPQMAEAVARSGAVGARMLAREAQVARCSKAYNVIVVPADSGSEGAWYAYLVAATTDPELLVLGGHHRLTVSRDGTKLEDQRAHTRTCLNLQRKPDMKFAVVSHLLDPYPTEVHVFLSHLYRMSIGVITQPSSLVWIVEGSRIGVLGKSDPSKPQPGPTR